MTSTRTLEGRAASRWVLELYRVAVSRGREVIQEILGPKFSGALLTDGWAGYINLPCTKGQDTAHPRRRYGGLLVVAATR